MPDISRRKGNQAMKFDQLTECNIRQNVVKELIPDRYLKS